MEAVTHSAGGGNPSLAMEIAKKHGGNIDAFQMSIKCPTSGGQTCDQEAAVQQTFHLERSSFFYLSVLNLM